MKHEFKVTKSKEQTVYTLESATGGSTSSGDFATVDTELGVTQRRNPPGDNILAQEKKETPTPRNFVAKNAKMGGAGQHKDKKKAAKQGDVKHKKPLAEDDQGNVSDTELDTIDPQDHGSMEGSFVKNQIHTMLRVLTHLEHAIGDEEDLPEWVQMKLSQAQESVVGVMNFMISDKEREVERQTGNDSLMKEELQARLAELKAKVEGVYRNKYHANTTGFSKGPRDPEGQDDPREFRKYNLTIDGKPLNPQPIMGRSNLIKWGRGQAAAGVDLSNAMISLVDEDAYMESLTNMLERSVSQAQHNLMVGVAHNPQFAQKVKVKQKVGQEFAQADVGHDISKLPIRVPKKK